MGPFGRASAGLFYGLAGVCGYALIALGVVAAIRTLLERDAGDAARRSTVGTLLGVVSLATLVHLAAAGYRVAGHGPGGAIGEHLAEILRAVISTAGTALLACVGLVVAVVVATPLRMRDVLRAIGSAIATVGARLQAGAVRVRAVLGRRVPRDPARAQRRRRRGRGRRRGRRGRRPRGRRGRARRRAGDHRARRGGGRRGGRAEEAQEARAAGHRDRSRRRRCRRSRSSRPMRSTPRSPKRRSARGSRRAPRRPRSRPRDAEARADDRRRRARRRSRSPIAPATRRR